MAKRSKAHNIAKLIGLNGNVKDEKVSATSSDIGEIAVGSTSITVGDKSLDSDSILDFTLDVDPETFTFNVDAPDAGQNAAWKWSWDAGTVAYDRAKITNVTQGNVPLYKQGTYTLRNFAARDLHSNMTQTHKLYLKWLDGAGLDNLVTSADGVTYDSENNILNPVTNTRMSTQKLNIAIGSNFDVPNSFTNPSVSYNVTAVTGAYVISGSAIGNNATLGPVYRGGTYTFVLDSDTTGHPFYITTDNGDNFVSGSYVGEYTTGVTNSRANGIATVTWVVDSDLSNNTMYYQCGIHAAMRGTINIKTLKADSDGNGDPILYFQHTQEGHKTQAEIRDVPTIPDKACLVFNATSQQFEPQDMGQYLDNTTQFSDKIKSLITTNTFDSDSAAVIAKENTVFNISMYQQDDLSVHTGTARWYAPFNLQIDSIVAKLGTAADATVTVDINKNGSSAETFSFAASSTTATITDQNITMNEGDYLSIDVDAIGTTAKGKDLIVQFKYKKI